jgi:hypothetical protein
MVRKWEAPMVSGVTTLTRSWAGAVALISNEKPAIP